MANRIRRRFGGWVAVALVACGGNTSRSSRAHLGTGPAHQSASPDWCSAEHECTRAALLGEITVRVQEYLGTSCYPVSADQWQCECGVGGEQISFAVENEDSWSTCTEASARCVQSFASSG